LDGLLVSPVEPDDQGHARLPTEIGELTGAARRIEDEVARVGRRDPDHRGLRTAVGRSGGQDGQSAGAGESDEGVSVHSPKISARAPYGAQYWGPNWLSRRAPPSGPPCPWPAG